MSHRGRDDDMVVLRRVSCDFANFTNTGKVYLFFAVTSIVFLYLIYTNNTLTLKNYFLFATSIVGIDSIINFYQLRYKQRSQLTSLGRVTQLLLVALLAITFVLTIIHMRNNTYICIAYALYLVCVGVISMLSLKLGTRCPF